MEEEQYESGAMMKSAVVLAAIIACSKTGIIIQNENRANT